MTSWVLVNLTSIVALRAVYLSEAALLLQNSLILRKTEPQHCRDGNVRSEVDGRVHDNLSGARENSRFLSRVVVSARQLLMYNPSTQEEA